jgi:flagellar assembly protein FliH
MAAPAKFLFDVDFAAGSPREPTVTLSDHAVKLAEAEAAARQRGYAEGQHDAEVENGRRIASTLERIATGIDHAAGALKAIEARLECEAVEVAVAVARKLAPSLIEREPFAEISALAGGCFRELVAAPHIAVRVNEGLYAAAREKIDDIARAHGFAGRLVVLGEPNIAAGDCRIEWADMSDDGKVPLPNLEDRAVQPDMPMAPEPDGPTSRVAGDLEAVFDVPVQVSAVLGRARMEINDLLKIGPGTVLELDRKVGEAIDIYVNNRLVARGEVVLVEEKLGVTMTEII